MKENNFIRNVEAEARNLIAPLDQFQQYALFGITLEQLLKRNPENRQYELLCVLRAIHSNRNLSKSKLTNISKRFKGAEKWMNKL